MSDLVTRIQGKTTKHQVNRFDISCNRKFTAPVGALLPVYFRELEPGNHISINLSNLTRTMPMVKASYARITENFDVFFVPFRLLYDGVQSMLAGTNFARFSSNQVPDFMPAISNADIRNMFKYFNDNKLSDSAGLPCSIGTARLFDLLGYGIDGNLQTKSFSFTPSHVFNAQDSTNSSINLKPSASDDLKYSVLPFLAYQKIYQDYFRNKYWEKENYLSYWCTPRYNVHSDLVQNGTFDLQYANFDKDRIFGMMPDTDGVFSQGVTSLNVVAKTNHTTALGGVGAPDGNASVPTDSLLGTFVADNTGLTGQELTTFNELVSNLSKSASYNSDMTAAIRSSITALTALNLRRIQALQRFAEVTALNKDDYKHQMQAHFDANIPDLNSDYSQYIGGKSQPVVISEVEQTSFDSSDIDPDSNQLGSLAGRGTVFGKSNNIDYTASEHGYLMVIYHLQPHIDYFSTAIDPQLCRFDRYDFMLPEFGDLGFEPVKLGFLQNTSYYTATGASPNQTQVYNPNTTLGYLPRYYSYKTDVDKCFGGFSDNTYDMGLKAYVIGFSFDHFCKVSNQNTFPSSNGMTFKLDYRFFKIYPSIIDSLFYVNSDGSPSTDPFIVNSDFNIVVDLPLSVDGLPY